MYIPHCIRWRSYDIGKTMVLQAYFHFTYFKAIFFTRDLAIYVTLRRMEEYLVICKNLVILKIIETVKIKFRVNLSIATKHFFTLKLSALSFSKPFHFFYDKLKLNITYFLFSDWSLGV